MCTWFPSELLFEIIGYNKHNELLKWRQVSRQTRTIAEELMVRQHEVREFAGFPNIPILMMTSNEILMMRQMRQPCYELKLLICMLLSLHPNVGWQAYLQNSHYHPDWSAVRSMLQQATTVKWLKGLNCRLTHDYLKNKGLFVSEIMLQDGVADVIMAHLDSFDWFDMVDGGVAHRIYFALLACCDVWQLGPAVNLCKVHHQAKAAMAARKLSIMQ